MKCILRYFILSDATVNGVLSKRSVSDRHVSSTEDHATLLQSSVGVTVKAEAPPVPVLHEKSFLVS